MRAATGSEATAGYPRGDGAAWSDALLDITRRVARWPGNEEILEGIVQVAQDMLAADIAVLSLLEPDGEHIRNASVAGRSGEQTNRLRGRRYRYPRYALGR